MPTRLLCVLVLVAVVTPAPAVQAAGFFEQKIRPILVERCFRCHSAESGKRMSGLALDTREGLLKGGDAGPAIVPGRPGASLLIKAIRGEDDWEMPPDGKLAPKEVAVLEAWVKQGARWPAGDGRAAVAKRTRPSGPTLTPARLWQASPRQYQNAVEEVIGAPVDLSGIEIAERHDGFLTPANRELGGEAFMASLEEGVARIAARHAPKLARKLGCALETADGACLRAFVEPFGRKLFRSPQVDSDVFTSLFEALRPQFGAGRAFESMLAALLLSPKAIFRHELGDQENPAARGGVRMTPGELAESLALTIWNRPPDEELLRVAAQGGLRGLRDPVVYREQVDRLFDHQDGNGGVLEFISQWLGVAAFSGVDKNPGLFPMFTADLKRSMFEETQRFVSFILTRRKANLVDLLTWQESFLDERLAEIYGVPAQGLGAGSGAWRQVALPAAERGGAFTLPAVVAAMSEPSLTGVVYRGKVLLDKLLCIDLHPPNMDVEFPDPDKAGLPKDATTRERLQTVENEAACKGCHVLMHPFSFPMESYDPIGRFRVEERKRPIDPSGRLAFSRSAAAPYKNAVELFRVLAGSDKVHQCFVNQAFRYVYGRPEASYDAPVLAAAYESFKAAGLDIRALYRALVLSDAFTHRERKGTP